MSRRSAGAQDDDSRAKFELSRRKLIASTVAAAIAKDTRPSTDAAVGACQTWLALAEEQDALTQRWQALETYLIRERNLFELERDQRAAIPEAIELDIIDHRIETLHSSRQELLLVLPSLAASTLQGLALKLAVAAIIVQPDENAEAHSLINSVVSDLRHMVEI